MLGHKASPSKFKKSEMTSSIFSGSQWYETRNHLHEDNQKYGEIKQHTTEQPSGSNPVDFPRKSKEKREKQLETNLNKNRTYEIYKFSSSGSNCELQGTRKRANEAQSQQNKGTKIIVGINETETIENIGGKISDTKKLVLSKDKKEQWDFQLDSAGEQEQDSDIRNETVTATERQRAIGDY